MLYVFVGCVLQARSPLYVMLDADLVPSISLFLRMKKLKDTDMLQQVRTCVSCPCLRACFLCSSRYAIEKECWHGAVYPSRSCHVVVVLIISGCDPCTLHASAVQASKNKTVYIVPAFEMKKMYNTPTWADALVTARTKVSALFKT